MALMRKPKFLKKKRVAKKKMAKKPLVKTIKRVVKAEARRELETKYCAVDATFASPVLQAVTTPANFLNLTIPITQGTNDNQRIGDSIRPIVCKAHFTFYFNTDTTNNQDLLVNFWIVRSKSAKAPQQIASLTGGNLLKLGNGANVDANNPNQPQMLTCVSTYPLNKDAYIPLMHKQFRMRKGFGLSAGTSVAGYIAPTGTAASEDVHRITYSWNPAVHNYDPGLPGPFTNFPVNECPVAIVWATNADGSGGTQNLVYGLRLEEFYKDA